MEQRWEACSKILTETAEEMLGTQRDGASDDWFDEECREATRRKNQAYLDMQQVCRAKA